MTTKLPSLSRRPSGLNPMIEKAIQKEFRLVSADDVQDVIEGTTSVIDDGSVSNVETMVKESIFEDKWIWWTLKTAEVAQKVRQTLGAPDESIEDVCKRLAQRYVYGAFRNEVFDRRANEWISIPAMDNLEAVGMPLSDTGRPLSAFNLLKRDRNASRVHNERYLPGHTEEIVFHNEVDWLNTWKPSDVEPRAALGKKGVNLTYHKPLLDHINYLCNFRKTDANHILDWLAYMVQNPGAKINHALLIISPEQGVGKDTLALTIQRILGNTNVKMVSDDDVSEGRNDFMKRAQLVIVPETMSGDRKDLANKLKPLITQEVVRINEKNVKPYDIENTVNFMMFSNHESAAHIEEKDRRYFVKICRQKPRSPDYYTKLYDYINGDGIELFTHYLMTRNLDHFNPKSPAPWTADKLTVQQATRGGVEAWLDDAYDSMDAPFQGEIINLRDALTVIQDKKGPRMTVQQIAAFLKKKGGCDLGKRRVPNKGQIRLWATRDGDDILRALDGLETSIVECDGTYEIGKTSTSGKRVVSLK